MASRKRVPDPVRIEVILTGPRKIIESLSPEEREAIVREWAQTGKTPRTIRAKSVVYENPGRSKVKDRAPRTEPDTEKARDTLHLRRLLLSGKAKITVS